MPLGLFNHPLFFAAAAVFAIGVVVYEYVSNQEEKKMQHRGRNNRRRLSPPPDPFTHRRRPPSPPSDPFTHRRRPPSPPSDPFTYRKRPPSPPSDPFTHRKRPPSPADSFTSCKSKSPSPPPDSSVRRRLPQQSYSPDHSASPPPESYSPENNLIKHNADKTLPKKSFSADLNVKNEESTGSSARLREQNQTASDVQNIADLNVKNEESTGSSACLREQNQTASDVQNIDNKVFDEKNYNQNIFDKFTNDIKHINQNLTKENNLVAEEESDSSENNNLPKSENNFPLGTQNKCTKKDNCHSKVNQIEDGSASQSSCMHSETDSDSISSVKSAISSSSSNSEKGTTDKEVLKGLKKKKVHTNKRKCSKCLERKVKNVITGSDSCKANEASSSRSACSATLKSRSSSSSSISDEDSNNKEVYEAQNPKSEENIEKDKLPKSELCEACLKENINASFSPCNHSYLCADCALKFSRISKKCSKCDEGIKSIQFVPR